MVTKALQGLLENPALCHPRNNGGRAMANTCGAGTSPVAIGSTPATSTSENLASNASSVPGTASHSASEFSGPDTGINVESPAQPFSNLLWELEQPGMQISENENFKKMELDLRSLIGPSYDQLLSLDSSGIQSMGTGSG